MATSLDTLLHLTRLEVEDYGTLDRLTTGINDTATTVTVMDGARFAPDTVIWVDTEACYISGVNGDVLTIIRGWLNSSAATHAQYTQVYADPQWPSEILVQWLNEALGLLYPKFYVRQTTALTGSSTDYEYDLPDDLTEERQMERLEAAHDSSSPTRWDDVTRGIKWRSGKLYVPYCLAGTTLSLTYTKQFPPMASGGSTDLPARARMLPVYYAAAQALEQKEAKRARFDNYSAAIDEKAAREGENLVTSDYYFRQFKKKAAMLRMPKPGRLRLE